MSNRNWFYASEGQQKGPLPEAQLRDLIARGMVRPDTLVWTEGMSGWQKAGDIPGLIPSVGAPPAFPPVQAGGPPPVAASGGYSGGQLSIDFGIWDFTWRSLVYAIGAGFIIPFPWLLVWYLKWLVSRVQVPGRPNLSFEGSAMTIVPWFFGAVVVAAAIGVLAPRWFIIPVYLVLLALNWLLKKWIVANLASNGQPLGLSFSGSFWGYLGWFVLVMISAIAIVAPAWVFVAWMRWFCRNVEGTRHEITFNGTGLELLWRGIVAYIGFIFIIPIPWVYRWLMKWMASQTALVQRGAHPAE